MTGEVTRWGDDAMYAAAPIKKEGITVRPKVHLLWGTPDPLGAVAAVGRMFKGIPTYDLADITDEERRLYWEETFKSHLRAPHEFIQLHFFVEGVTRSHTHQMVRQRTATFAQESLRFAVKDNLAEEVALPPSIVTEDALKVWSDTVAEISAAYNRLVDAGIPAEDARGLLPHATTTRLHWRTNLNDLLHHAGNRLCTQAQFEWRYMMIEVIKAIKNYKSGPECYECEAQGIGRPHPDAWQWQLIAEPTAQTFAPICYHTGKCEFKAIFDRACSIRDRVEAFAEAGIPAEQWGEGAKETNGGFGPGIEPIGVQEWLMNPEAAR